VEVKWLKGNLFIYWKQKSASSQEKFGFGIVSNSMILVWQKRMVLPVYCGVKKRSIGNSLKAGRSSIIQYLNS
jgi:hypothetical protein